MARSFTPIVPPKDPSKCQPWLYNELRRVSNALTQTNQGLNAVVRNEVPDGSGSVLSPNLSLYFLLTGRSGGQVARGDTAPSGTLTLSSTNSSTKGKIYFGTAQGSAFDEANGFFGFGTNTPTARLHLLPDASSQFLNFESTVFTVTNCNAAITDRTVTTTSNFTPVGGPRVTPGMIVTGSGVPANTIVTRVFNGTTIWLSNAVTTALVNVTLTFNPSTLMRRTSDETGTDIDVLLRGALRLSNNGITGVPLRILADNVPENTVHTTLRTVASCSAAGGTHVITGGGLPGSVAIGDLVTGGTLPSGTFVTANGVGGQISVSTTPTAFGPSTLTFTTNVPMAIFEAGIISSGVSSGNALRFGGPNRGELARLTLMSRTMWLTRSPSSGNNVCIGININPQDFGSGGPTTPTTAVMLAGHLAFLNSGNFAFYDTSSGTTPSMLVGAKFFEFEASTLNGNLGWWTGAAGAEVRAFYIGRFANNSGGGSREGLRVVNQQSNPSGGFANNNILMITPALEWATVDVSPSFTNRLDFGDSLKGILSGHAGAKMTRFGICSDFVTIASATSRTIVVGLSLLHLELTGTTATIGQIIRASGAQSVDFFQIRDSGNSVLSGFNSSGAHFHVAGAGANKVWTSDASGIGSWQTPTGGAATITIRKNTGADVGTRPRLNFIEGSNITLTVTDDGVSNEVDITIASAAGTTGIDFVGNFLLMGA